jgi:hypothetical protein
MIDNTEDVWVIRDIVKKLDNLKQYMEGDDDSLIEEIKDKLKRITEYDF